MSTGIFTKVSGTWKEADDYFVNVNGTWRTGSELHAKVSGTWKQTAAAAPFNDTGNDVYIGPWSSSWTAPAGITQVRVTLTGGVSVDEWSTSGWSGGLRFTYTGTPGAITQASALAAFSAWETAHLGTINSGAPSQRYLTTAQRAALTTSYTVNTGETVTVYTNGPLQYNGANYPTPSVGIVGTMGSNSQQYVGDFGAYGNKMMFQSVYNSGLNWLLPAKAGITGATANMFGLSATGALTGQTPQTTGPTIVQVTPGTTYASSMGFVQTGFAYPFNNYVMGTVHIEW